MSEQNQMPALHEENHATSAVNYSNSHSTPSWQGVALAAGLTTGLLLGGKPAKAAHTFAGSPLTFNDIPGSGDIKILNYALALEDLEADFYDQLLKRLTRGGRNRYGETIDGLNLSGIDVTYVQRFGRVEAEHRDFLRATLRRATTANNVIQPFRYDFGLGNTDPNPLTREQLISLLLDIERTGVAAYLGAVPFFSARSPYLQTAVAIQGTEARHTSVITIISNILFNAQRNVAPVPNDLSSAARNDIDPFGREVTQNPNAPSPPLMTTPPAGQVFEAQPDTVANPNQVLAKVSPFIVRPNAPDIGDGGQTK